MEIDLAASQNILCIQYFKRYIESFADYEDDTTRNTKEHMKDDIFHRFLARGAVVRRGGSGTLRELRDRNALKAGQTFRKL